MDSTSLIDTEVGQPALPRFVRVFVAPVFVFCLLPFVFLVMAAVYVIAALEGTRMLFQSATGTTPAADLELPKPHFLELHLHAIQSKSAEPEK